MLILSLLALGDFIFLAFFVFNLRKGKPSDLMFALAALGAIFLFISLFFLASLGTLS